MGGFYIAGKTIIILPQLELVRGIQGRDLIFCYLGNLLMNRGGGSYLSNSPINGDPDIL